MIGLTSRDVIRLGTITVLGVLIGLVHWLVIRPLVYWVNPESLFGWLICPLIPAVVLLFRQILQPDRTNIDRLSLIIVLWVMVFGTIEFSWAGFHQVRASIPDQVQASHYRFQIGNSPVLVGTGKSAEVQLLNSFAAEEHITVSQYDDDHFILHNVSQRRKALVNNIGLLTIPLRSGDRIRISGYSTPVEFVFSQQESGAFLETGDTIIPLALSCRDLLDSKQRVLLITNKDPDENQLADSYACTFERSQFSILTHTSAPQNGGVSDYIAEIVNIEDDYYVRYTTYEARNRRAVAVQRSGDDHFQELQRFGKKVRYDAETELILGYSSYRLSGDASTHAIELKEPETNSVNRKAIRDGEFLFFQDSPLPLFQEGTHLPASSSLINASILQQECSSETATSYFFLPLRESQQRCLQILDPGAHFVTDTRDPDVSTVQTPGSQEKGLTLTTQGADSTRQHATWQEEEPLHLINGDHYTVSWKWQSADRIVNSVRTWWSLYYLAFILVFLFWISTGARLPGMITLLIGNLIIQFGYILLFKLGYHLPENFRWQSHILTQLKAGVAGMCLLGVLWLARNWNYRLWDWVLFRFFRNRFYSWGKWTAFVLSTIPTHYKLVFLSTALLVIQIVLGDETGIPFPVFGKLQLVDAIKLLYIFNIAAIAGQLLATYIVQLDKRDLKKEPAFRRLSLWSGRFFIMLFPVFLITFLLRDLSQIMIFLLVVIQVFIIFHQSFFNFVVRFSVVGLLLLIPLWIGAMLDSTASERFAVFFNPWSLEGSSSSGQFISNLWAVKDGGLGGVGLLSRIPQLPVGVQDDFIMTLHSVLFGSTGLIVLFICWFVFLVQVLLFSARLYYDANLAQQRYFQAPECDLRYSSLLFFVSGLGFIHLFFSIANMTGIFPVIGQPMVYVSASGANLLILGFGFIGILLFSSFPGKGTSTRAGYQGR